MKRKITLKDIAKELDVSISTVSKALKNSIEIGQDTKDKVQAFARLYNYKPNNIALSLKNKQTKNIGVLVPNIVHHFYTTVFRGIESYANTKGYNVIVCVSDESFEKEVINMEMLANGSVDGFILALAGDTQLKNDFYHIKEVLDQGMPIVLYDRITNEVDCDKVIIDDKNIAYLATKKLISEGRKNIALFTTKTYFNVSEARAEGFKMALKEANLNSNLVLTLPIEDEKVDLIERFVSSNKVDAVLCVNELFAIIGMSTVQKMGYSIPSDMSFIGFTDGILSKHATPTLTTVAQHGEQMGEIAAKMLIERIEQELESDVVIPFRTEIINATIVERDSTLN